MNQTNLFIFIGVCLGMGLVLSGCSREEEEASTERATAVTLAWPQIHQIERIETAVGRLEALAAPSVSAETSGRISRIVRDAGDHVQAGDLLAELDAQAQQIAVNSASAEVRRLEALLDNQTVQLERLQNLARRQSVAQDQLDEASTSMKVIGAQLDEARARLEDAEFNLSRTRIVSPVTGQIQRRLVSTGDFVSSGRNLFELISPEALRAIVPIPERLQDAVAVGQIVRLSIPARTDDWIESRIAEIRPLVGPGSRAIELIVDLDNPGSWRSGGSVSARVVLEQREGLVVPRASLVRRPAGKVIFVFDGEGRARQREVSIGVRSADWIEITEGLGNDEPVVVDGAGFLSDDVLLDVQEWIEPELETRS